jgi:hypothetical protein
MGRINDKLNTTRLIPYKKSITVKGVEVHRVVRRRGSHIFYTIGSEMAMRLSALGAGLPLPPGRFLVLISVRHRFDPRATMQLKD